MDAKMKMLMAEEIAIGVTEKPKPPAPKAAPTKTTK
jgi:hypothetical protein